MPDVTFIATANAVTLTGATPVLRRHRSGARSTWIPTRFARAITPRTKAVVPVHVSGRGAGIERILDDRRARTASPWSKTPPKRCARSTDGRCLGTFGRAGCFSFSPNKTITTGQGGLVVTDDDALAVRLRELKDQGRPVRGTGGNDVHATLGFNFKLTNLQAAVGMAQLARLDARVERLRRDLSRVSPRPGRTRPLRLLPFDVDRGETPQWVDALAERRDGLVEHLIAREHPLPAVLVPDPHAAAVPPSGRELSQRHRASIPQRAVAAVGAVADSTTTSRTGLPADSRVLQGARARERRDAVDRRFSPS